MKEGPRPTQTVKVDPDHQVSVKEEPIEDIPPQVLVSVKMEKIDFSMTGLASLADSQSSSQDLKPLVKGKACLLTDCLQEFFFSVRVCVKTLILFSIGKF